MRAMKDSGVPWLKEIPVDWKVERGKNVLALQKRPVRDNDEVVTCAPATATTRSRAIVKSNRFIVKDLGRLFMSHVRELGCTHTAQNRVQI